MKKFTGIPASAGIVVAKALVYTEKKMPKIPNKSITEAEIPAEWDRLERAFKEASRELRELHEQAVGQMSQKQADIVQAQLFMLEDEDYKDQLKDRIQTALHNAGRAVGDMSREFSDRLMQSPDPVLRERAADIADVSRRIIDCLYSVKRGHSVLTDLTHDIILVAHDLMPSDTLMMNRSRVKGIALDEGSSTSHTAILARAFNIPAVLGLSRFSREIKSGETLALNGTSGTVVVNPDKRTMTQYNNEEKTRRKETRRVIALRDLPAQTTDGHRVTINANIGLPEEAENALYYGAEGVGLFRSELLLISAGKATNEEAQYDAYCHVLKTMGKLPVTIRTMDIGGDKVAGEMQAVHDRQHREKNPLLGLRAIRLSLANPELFKVQLRALLRTSVHGNARVMFPMISGIEELEHARALLDEARTECKKKKQRFSKTIEVGVMIEVPSAAMISDILAEKSDFFSIGTNDLVQYSLAVDRGNEKVQYLNDFHHPAVLRFLKKTIDAAHDRGIKAAMCGELAGNPAATALLLGLGLDEFSMEASSIPQIKETIRGTSLKSCKKLAAKALKGRSIAEVQAVVKAWSEKNA